MKNLLLVISFIFSFTVFAKKEIDVYVALRPAGSFHITTKKIKGSIKKKGSKYVAKKIFVKIRHLKTGMGLRDSHMKQALKIKKHPEITVTDVKAESGKGNAMMTIKGIKKPISFTYKVKNKNFKASFHLNLRKFKVKKIGFAGASVNRTVRVTASIPIK